MDLVNVNQSPGGEYIGHQPVRVLYNKRYKDKGVLFIGPPPPLQIYIYIYTYTYIYIHTYIYICSSERTNNKTRVLTYMSVYCNNPHQPVVEFILYT